MVENARRMVMRHNVAREIAIQEMAEWNERKMIGREPKGKVVAHCMAMECQPDARDKSCAGWQRRPAAIITIVPPANPGWTPDTVGSPAPAKARVLEPTSIMKRCPTPRIIGHPIPAAISVNPAPAIEVRLPAVIGDSDRGLPATATSFNVHPIPVRGQRIVIICVISRRWFRFRRRVIVKTVGLARSGFGGSREALFSSVRRVHRWICCRKFGFAWRHGDIRGGSLKQMISLQHCGDDPGRNSNVIEINDFLSSKIECAKGIRDEGQHHPFFDACIGQLDDFSSGGSRFEIGRDLDFSGNFFGRRSGNTLPIGCS